MVEFSQLSSTAQDNVNRILRGRSPNPDKSALNEAINFINENPDLRNVMEGASPTGLSPQNLEAYKQQSAFETIPGSPAPQYTPVYQGIPGKTATEEAMQMSLPENLRYLSVSEVQELQRTNQPPTFIEAVKESAKIFPLGLTSTPQYDPETGKYYYQTKGMQEKKYFDPSSTLSAYIKPKYESFVDSLTPGVAKASLPIIKLFTPKGFPEPTEQQLIEVLQSPVENVKYSDIAKWAFFAPAFMAGTTTQAEAEITYTSYGKKARDIFAYFEKLTAKDKLREASNTLSKIIKTETDPIRKQNAVNNVKKLLDALREKGLVGDYAINEVTGQVLIGRGPSTRVFTISKSSQVPASIGRANIPYSSSVGSVLQTGSSIFFKGTSQYAGTGQYEQQSFTAPKLKPSQRFISINTIPLLTPATILTTQGASAQQMQQEKQLQSPFFAPAQRTLQLQRAEQSQQPRLRQDLFFTPSLKTQQVQRQELERPQRTRLKIPQGGGGRLYFPESPEGEKVRVKRFPSETKGYIPQVKDKGKWINVFKKPLIESQARALALDVVDQTTSAQMRLLPSKGSIVKLKGIPGVLIGKFRDYQLLKGKRIGLPNKGLIEKRTHRIDTANEKKQLSVARYLKQKQKVRTIQNIRTRKRRAKKLFFK